MKRLCALVFTVCLISICPAQIFAANDMTGNVNLSLGIKVLDNGDWDPVEDQGEIGIDVDFRNRSWPINLVIALFASGVEEDDDIIEGYDAEGTTSEFRFGVRKIWQPDQFMRPFLGGGLAFIGADYEAEYSGVRISDDDAALGGWIEGGVYWTVNRNFNLGFNIGLSTADVDLFGSSVDAGGGHLGLLAGYHW